MNKQIMPDRAAETQNQITQLIFTEMVKKAVQRIHKLLILRKIHSKYDPDLCQIPVYLLHNLQWKRKQASRSYK